MNTLIDNAQAIEAVAVVLNDSDNALAMLQSNIASLSKKESHLAKVAAEFQTRQIDFFDSLVAVLQVAQQDFGLYGKLGKMLATVSNPIIKAVMAAKNVDGIMLKDAYSFDVSVKSFKLKKNQQHTAAAFLSSVVNPFKPVVTETSDTPNGGNGGNGGNGDTPNGDNGDTSNGGNGESDKPKATDLEKDIKSLDAIVKAISAINKRNTKQPLIGADMVTSIADLLADCQTRQAQIVEKYAAIKAAADAESAAQEQKAA
jgi:hypothetical protein